MIKHKTNDKIFSFVDQQKCVHFLEGFFEFDEPNTPKPLDNIMVPNCLKHHVLSCHGVALFARPIPNSIPIPSKYFEILKIH